MRTGDLLFAAALCTIIICRYDAALICSDQHMAMAIARQASDLVASATAQHNQDYIRV